jgi:hypothetical protein
MKTDELLLKNFKRLLGSNNTKIFYGESKQRTYFQNFRDTYVGDELTPVQATAAYIRLLKDYTVKHIAKMAELRGSLGKHLKFNYVTTVPPRVGLRNKTSHGESCSDGWYSH